MGKINVNGSKADPLFEWLKAEKPGIMGLKIVKWNFEKFLVGRDGKVTARWSSSSKPEALEAAVLEQLKKGAKEPVAGDVQPTGEGKTEV